jgi:hypothetical protein
MHTDAALKVRKAPPIAHYPDKDYVNRQSMEKPTWWES